MPVMWIFLSALAALALNLFVIAPALTSTAGDLAANFTYMAIRLIAIIGFSFAMTAWARRKRIQVLTATTFLEFFDQAVFKGILLAASFRSDPKAWQGATLEGALLGMAISYILYVPIICLLGWIGYELGTAYLGRKQRKAA